jgi:hypothetical protein
MATMDIFETDAFSVIELTRALENIPFKPATLSGSGLFSDRGVRVRFRTGIAMNGCALRLKATRCRSARVRRFCVLRGGPKVFPVKLETLR